MTTERNLILVADTSTPLGSVAVLQSFNTGLPAKVLGEKSWDKQQSHSEIIALEAKNLLAELNISISQIESFGCGIGPGSFTGIRVALNFIKSLAYSYNKPVFTINSLRLLALPALQKSPLVFCMQSAFRDLIYVAQYQIKNAKILEKIPPTAWTMDQLNENCKNLGLVVGDAFSQYKKSISPDLRPSIQSLDELENRPRSSSFKFCDFTSTDQFQILQWFQVQALYVRASEAEEKLRKGGSNSSDRQRGENP